MAQELDRIDKALLVALSRNARASGALLATEVGIAESTVSLRLRRLQSLGVLRGYRLDLDLSSLGVSLQALIAVRLTKHDRSEIDAFRQAMPFLPGVIGVFHMAGADDYLLHVAVRDADELRDFVLENLTEHPAVSHTQTNLIFEYAEGVGWQGLFDAND